MVRIIRDQAHQNKLAATQSCSRDTSHVAKELDFIVDGDLKAPGVFQCKSTAVCGQHQRCEKQMFEFRKSMKEEGEQYLLI